MSDLALISSCVISINCSLDRLQQFVCNLLNENQNWTTLDWQQSAVRHKFSYLDLPTFLIYLIILVWCEQNFCLIIIKSNLTRKVELTFCGFRIIFLHLLHPSLFESLHFCVIISVVQDIVNAWKGLENVEKGYEEWLLSEMQRYYSSMITNNTDKYLSKMVEGWLWAAVYPPPCELKGTSDFVLKRLMPSSWKKTKKLAIELKIFQQSGTSNRSKMAE